MLVVIFNIGNLSYSEYSLEVLNHYFNKYKIKYEVVTEFKHYNPKNAHPSWMKCLVHRMFPNQEFILAWDLDLLPIKSAYNIETLIDKTKLNLAYDTSYVLGYELFTPKTFKYNCGLIGIPKKSSLWIENIYDTIAPGTYPSWEQYYVNERIYYDNIPVHLLPNEINTLYPKKDDYGWELWKNAVFKHFSCCGNSEEKIKEHRDDYFK